MAARELNEAEIDHRLQTGGGGSKGYDRETLKHIRGMRMEVAHASYKANYYTATGQRDRASPYYEKLKKLFKKSDEPRYRDEDARDSLQRIAAKERGKAVRDGRRYRANYRRTMQADRKRSKASTKRLGSRVRLVKPSDS